MRILFLFARNERQLRRIIDVGVVCQRRRHQVLRVGVLQELADHLDVADVQVGERFVDEHEAAGTVIRFQQADQGNGVSSTFHPLCSSIARTARLTVM